MASGRDESAFFEDKVTELLDDLFGAALRLAKNRQDAEDLVAEAVAKAWGSRHLLKDPERFRPWIFRILTNTFITECRKRSVRPQAVPLESGEGEADTSFSIFERLHQPFLLWWGNPEREFMNKILREDLERALDSLQEDYRVAIVLSDLEGFSYQDMAKMLKVPVGTVRSRIARGRGLLQKALWNHAVEAGLVAPKKRKGDAHEENQNDRL
jgi:RNA polymerase sigma-70 factor (ECF subfamily)